MDVQDNYEQRSQDLLTVLTTEREELLACKGAIPVEPIRSVSDEDWVENYWRKNKNGRHCSAANRFIVKKAMVNVMGAMRKQKIIGFDRLNI